MTRYIWDVVSDNVLMETDDAGETTAVYTQEPDLYGELISQHRDGQTTYYHFDGQGDTRAMTDENQNVVETATYSAFGEVVQKTSSIVNPFGYKGALGYYTSPATGDIDVRARVYQPTTGRWMSLDPAGFVDGPSRYIYVLNDPIYKTDPSGLVCMVCKSGINESGDVLSVLDDEVEGQPYTDLANAMTDATNRRYPIHQTLKGIGKMDDFQYPTRTGRYGIGNAYAPLKPPLPAGNYAVAARLHFVWFDVREDNSGDCLIRLVEREAQQEYRSGWKDDPGFPRILERLFKAPNTSIGSTTDVMVKLAQPYDCCKYRIIVGDMSSIDTVFKEFRHHLIPMPQMIRRNLIEQWVWVLNNSPRNIVGHEFSKWTIGFNPTGTMIV